jgi:hypothetical protein
MRARFFADPARHADRSLPPHDFFDREPAPRFWAFKERKWRRKELEWKRRRLAQEVLKQIVKSVNDGTLTAAVNTDSVYEEYLAPLANASRRALQTAYWLSWGAFVVGVILIGVGIWLVLNPVPDSEFVVASLLGTGAISSLGAILGMALRGTRSATTDHVRLHLVLTAFAGQLGAIRAMSEMKDDHTSTDELASRLTEVNRQTSDILREAMNHLPPSSL